MVDENYEVLEPNKVKNTDACRQARQQASHDSCDLLYLFVHLPNLKSMIPLITTLPEKCAA